MKSAKIILMLVAGLCLPLACELPEQLSSEDMTVDQVSEKPFGKTLNNVRTGDHPHGLDQDRYVTMKTTGLKVHYRIIGKGPINMVFIPGWTNPLEVYSKQFDYFREKARCIYIDVPGQGLSDAPEGVEYTMGLMAEAIYDVVTAEEAERFIGVGFSMGNAPLKEFERRYPGRITQLIFLDVGLPTWPPLTEEIREATYAQQLTWTPEIKTMLLHQLIPPETAPDDLIALGQYFLDFPNWLLANIYYHRNAEEMCQPYPWTVPIMVIYRDMKEVKEAKTKLFFPNCEIHVIGGDQHVIQWAYKDVVNQLMDDFIMDRPGRKY